MNSTDKEMDSNQRFVKQSISLKLINGGPNKARGFEQNKAFISGGIYLAPDSINLSLVPNRSNTSPEREV